MCRTLNSFCFFTFDCVCVFTTQTQSNRSRTEFLRVDIRYDNLQRIGTVILPSCHHHCSVTAQDHRGTVSETEWCPECCRTTAACRRRTKTTLLSVVRDISLTDSSDPITASIFIVKIKLTTKMSSPGYQVSGTFLTIHPCLLNLLWR